MLTSAIANTSACSWASTTREAVMLLVSAVENTCACCACTSTTCEADMLRKRIWQIAIWTDWDFLGHAKFDKVITYVEQNQRV